MQLCVNNVYYIVYQISGNQTIAASTSAISFFIYEKATLFPSTLLVNESRGKDKEVKRVVGSYVVSGTVEGVEVKNLSDDSPVEILFALKEVSIAGCSWSQVTYRSEKMFHIKINTKMHLFFFSMEHTVYY